MLHTNTTPEQFSCGSAHLLESLRVAVQALGSVIGDQQQFASLDPGPPVAGHDVGLYDHGHPGGQREAGCR